MSWNYIPAYMYYRLCSFHFFFFLGFFFFNLFTCYIGTTRGFLKLSKADNSQHKEITLPLRTIARFLIFFLFDYLIYQVLNTLQTPSHEAMACLAYVWRHDAIVEPGYRIHTVGQKSHDRICQPIPYPDHDHDCLYYTFYQVRGLPSLIDYSWPLLYRTA